MSYTTNTIGWPPYYTSHTHSIGHTHSFAYQSPPAYPFQEPEMSVAEKIAKERKEAKERDRIETQYALYDELELDVVDPGTVYQVMFDGDHYGALVKVDDDTWSVTGGPHRANLEDVISWLIRQGVPAGRVQ